MSEEKPQEYPPQQEYPTQPESPPQQEYPPQPGYPTQPGYPPQPGYPTQQPDPAQQPRNPPTEQPCYPAGPPPGTEPPPPGYRADPPQQAGPRRTVYSIPVKRYTDSPANGQCPNCHSNVRSKITRKSGWLVVLMMLRCLLFQLWCGCCLIPLCNSDLKNVRHNCPVCSYELAYYKRL